MRTRANTLVTTTKTVSVLCAAGFNHGGRNSADVCTFFLPVSIARQVRALACEARANPFPPIRCFYNPVCSESLHDTSRSILEIEKQLSTKHLGDAGDWGPV